MLINYSTHIEGTSQHESHKERVTYELYNLCHNGPQQLYPDIRHSKINDLVHCNHQVINILLIILDRSSQKDVNK